MVYCIRKGRRVSLGAWILVSVIHLEALDKGNKGRKLGVHALHFSSRLVLGSFPFGAPLRIQLHDESAAEGSMYTFQLYVQQVRPCHANQRIDTLGMKH